MAALSMKGGNTGDVVEFEIAENGEIIWKTNGGISSSNHASADRFTKEVEKLAGGEVRRESLKKDHHHHHAETGNTVKA
jgi:hypothetical protein